MRTEWKDNQCLLVGELMQEPEFSHENHGEDFFRLTLRVERLSGKADEVHLIVSRTQLEECPVVMGDRIRAEGEMRSHNNHSGQGSRLQIFLFVRRLARTAGRAENQILLSGVLCRPPVYRRTPLGREICDLMLAVRRPCGRADYLPCIAWGSLARRCGGLSRGAQLSLSGRLQSRVYTKTVDGMELERTAFEISIMEMMQDSPGTMQEIPSKAE